MKPEQISGPPAAEENGQALTARTLTIILLSLLGAVAVISILLVVTRQYRALPALLLSMAAVLPAFWLARRGALAPAGLWTVLVMLTAATYITAIGDGLQDIAVLVYPVVLVVSGLLLGRRSFVLVIVLTLLMVAGVACLQASRPQGAGRDVAYVVADGLTAAIILTVTAVGVYLLSDAMRRSLSTAQRELAERRQTEERYRLISSVISDYTFTTHIYPDGALENTWLGGAFESITGYTPEEFRATGGWRAHLHPDDRAQDERDMQQLRANQRVVTEVRVIRKGGDVRWVRVYAHPVWDHANNRLAGIYGAVQDVTERRLAEERLREAELQYRTLVEQTSVVIYRDAPDPNATPLYISPQIQSLVGYSPAEWTAGPDFWQSLLHPEDREHALNDVRKYLSGEGVYVSQYRLRTRAGRWVWIRDEAVVVRDDEGQPRYVQGVLSDITERMQAEEALMHYASRLEILHSIDRAILAARSPDEIATTTLDRLCELMPCHYAAVVLFDFDNAEHEIVAVRRNGQTFTPGLRKPLHEFDLNEPLRRGQAHVVNDLAAVAAPSAVEQRIASEGVRSYIDSPLMVRGKLIGSLSLESPEVNTYDAERIKFIGELANQLAIAIEQSRLMDETTEALQREQRLNEVTRLISESSLDLPATLATIVRLAAELVGADGGMMGLVSPDGQSLTHPYLYNLPDDLGLDQPVPRGQGLSWQTIEGGRAVRVADYPSHPAALPNWARAGIHSVIDAPVVAGDERLGLLGLYRFDTRKTFSDRDLALVEAVARQAGIAIQNARLFEAERRRAATLSALHDIGLDLSARLDLPTLLRSIMEHAARLLNAPMGGLYLMRPEGDILDPVANLPVDDPSSPVKVGQGLVGRVAASGDPVLVDDYAAWPGRLPSVTNPAFRAVIGVPITWNERPLGVLSVCHPRPGRFKSDDIDIVRLFTAQAAIAIQNARLFEAEQQRVALFTALHETGLNMSAQLDLPVLLQTIVERAARFLNASMGSLFLVRPDEPVLDMVVRYNVPDEGVLQPIGALKFGEGLAGRVAEAGQALIVDDYHNWPGQAVPGAPYRSVLSIPIKWQNRVIGVINVLDEQPNRFSQSQIEPVSLLAAQASIAIQNARLFETTRRNVQELTVLHAAASAAAVAASEDELLEKVARIVQATLFSDVFGLALFDEATGNLRPHPASRGLSAEELAQISIPLTQGVVGRVAVTGQPKRIGDVRLDPDYVPITPETRSELCVPIKTANRLIGIINVESTRLEAYDAADERLLVTLAGQIATAIERLRTDAELRRLNSELERRVLERTAQLEAANRELETFSYSVSHDLRAPLRSINGFARLLSDTHAAHLGPEGQRYLSRIADGALRMGQLIDSLLDFSRLTRQPIHKQTVDVNQLCHRIAEDMRHQSSGREIVVAIDTLPPAQADPALLRQVLENLIDNAIKYSSRRSPARIHIGCRRGQPGPAVYYVRDNGVGFDLQYADKLFGVFQRLHSAEEFEGTGVGLATVKRIVERHGGRIWAEAEVDKGATFYFTLEP